MKPVPIFRDPSEGQGGADIPTRNHQGLDGQAWREGSGKRKVTACKNLGGLPDRWRGLSICLTRVPHGRGGFWHQWGREARSR